MTPKAVSRAEVQQIEEFVTLISCHSSLLPSEATQLLAPARHYMVAALLCNALLRASAEHGLSCTTLCVMW